MKYIQTYLLISLIILTNSQTYKTLAYSYDNRTRLIYPTTPKLLNKGTSSVIPQVQTAKFIWSGSGSASNCPLIIIVEDDIYITCLNKRVFMFIRADNKFNATFQGKQMSGISWSTVYDFELDSSVFVCSKLFHNSDGTYTFTITAQNTPPSSTQNCSTSNGAALIYGVAQQEYNTGCCLITQYYQRRTCQCYPCTNIHKYCLTCLNSTTCLTCLKGFYLQDNKCINQCGDGFLTQVQQCDDNNLQIGDGCSNICQIQQHFQCTTILNQVSVCKFNAILKIYVFEVIKQYYQNSGTVVIKIQPNISIFQKTNFSQIISQNQIDINFKIYNYQRSGLLFLNYEYHKSMESQIKLLLFNISKVSAQLSSQVQKYVYVEMVTTSNIPIIAYSDTFYQWAHIFQLWQQGIKYVSIIVFLLSFLSNHIICIQLILTEQIRFLSLGNIGKIHPLWTSILDHKFINGYNFHFQYFQRKIPNSIRAIGYSSNFISNVNLMFMLILVSTILSIFIQLSKNISGKKYSKINHLISNILYNNVFSLVMIQILNIGFVFNIHIIFGKFDIANSFIILVFLSLLIYIFVKHVYSKQSIGLKKYLKNNKSSQLYFSINLIKLIMSGAIIGSLSQNTTTLFITFSVQICMLVYFISVLPYKAVYSNYLGSICHFTSSSILLIKMFYKSMNASSYNISQQHILIMSIIQTVLICLCILLSFINIYFETLIKIKQACMFFKPRLSDQVFQQYKN